MIELKRTGAGKYDVLHNGTVVGVVVRDPYFPWVFKFPGGREIVLIDDTLTGIRAQLEKEYP